MDITVRIIQRNLNYFFFPTGLKEPENCLDSINVIGNRESLFGLTGMVGNGKSQK